MFLILYCSGDESAASSELRGLKFLNKTESLVLRPLCQNAEGSKFFEIRDNDRRKMSMVVERINAVDDVLVRDKYGTIRFCIYGSQIKRAQIDVYVTSEFPIGIVKKNVIYDQNKEPVCTVEPRDLNQCCGPPSFNIMSYDKQLVGRINPEHGEIFFNYDLDLQSTIKALIVSYCVQLAFSQYKMASDYLSLPLGTAPYKTKSPQRAAEEPAGAKPLHEPTLRPSSVKKAVRAEHDMRIPVTYRKLSIFDTVTEISLRMVGRDNEIEYYEILDPTDRIFLTFELNRILQEVIIKNRYGEKMFRLHGNTHVLEPLELTLVNGTPAGRIDGNKLYDQNNRLLLEARPYTNQCCGPLSYVIYQQLYNKVGYITPEGPKVRIGVDLTLDSIAKGLIISRAFNLAVTNYKLNQEPLPLVKYIYEDGSDTLHYRKLRSGTSESPERHGASQSQLAVLKPLTEVRLRAAGYNTRTVHYYELINSADDKIKLTFECREKEGLVEAKEKHGIPQYSGSGLWGMQSDLVINRNQTRSLGIVRNGIFLDEDGNKIMYAQQRSSPQVKVNGKLFAFKIFSVGNEAIGSIYPEISTVLIQVRRDLDVSYKALIFVFALKLAYNVYQLNKLPIPLVEYGYLPIPSAMKSVPPAILPPPTTGNGRTMATQPLPSLPGSSKATPKPAPTATNTTKLSRMLWPGLTGLTILRHVSTIKLQPIGFSRSNVRYYKLIDGERERSFLTCECASPADDMVLRDKYGDTRLYVQGAWDETKPLMVYISAENKLGMVVNDAIFDQNATPIYYINQTTSLFRTPVVKIVTPSATKKVMATLAMVDNQVVMTLDLSLPLQAKSLVLAYGLRMAFTTYGVGKMKLPRVRYEYVSKNKKKKHEKQSNQPLPAGGNMLAIQDQATEIGSGRPDTPAIYPDATATIANTAQPPATTVIPLTATGTAPTVTDMDDAKQPSPHEESTQAAPERPSITQQMTGTQTMMTGLLDMDSDTVSPAKEQTTVRTLTKVAKADSPMRKKELIHEKQKVRPATPKKKIIASKPSRQPTPQAGDSVSANTKPVESINQSATLPGEVQMPIGGKDGDSALLGVIARQSHHIPTPPNTTSMMTDLTMRQAEKVTKAK